MLLDILASKWTLIAVWVVGPAVLIYLHFMNRVRTKPASPATAEATTASHPSAGATPTPASKRDSAMTPIPGSSASTATPGFRDLKWGDPPRESMHLLGKDGEEAIYSRQSDLLRLEDVPVEAIQYVFSHGTLTSVRIDAALHAADPLVRGLSKHWGPPDTQDPKALKQHWNHLVSGPQATAAMLERNAVSRRTTLFIFRKAEKLPA